MPGIRPPARRIVVAPGTDLIAIAAILALTVGCFWKIIFTREYTLLSFYDDSVQSYAWYQFLSRAVAQSLIPLWDPFVYGGHPFTGEIQSGAFYLPNLVLAATAHGGLIPTSHIEVFLIAHAFLCACFTYVLGRYLGLQPISALVSAVAFSFGGVVLGRLQDQTNIYLGLIWLPLAMLFLEAGVRRRSFGLSACAGLALATSLLAGHIEPPYHIAIAMVLFVLYQAFRATCAPDRDRILLSGGVALATGALASSVQIMPAVEYGPLALRAVGGQQLVPSTARLSYTILSSIPVHPSNLVSIVLPRVNPPADTNPYLGLAVISLAIVAIVWSKHYWVGYLLVVGAFGLLTALSDSSVVHGWEYSLIPLSDRIREAGRRLYLFQFAASMLAGMGVECLCVASRTVSRDRSRSFIRWCVYPVGLFLFAGLAITLIPMYATADAAVPIREALLHTSLVGVALIGAIGAIGARRVGLQAGTLLLLMVVVWDLFSANVLVPQERSGYNNTSNLYPERYYTVSPIIKFLTDHATEGRVSLFTDTIPPNIGDVFAFRTVMGHGATLLSSYFEYLTGNWDPHSKFSQMMGVRYYVADKSLGSDLPIVSDGKVSVFSASTDVPRAWIVHNVDVRPTTADAVAMIGSNTFDIRREATVDGPPAAGALAPAIVGLPESATLVRESLQSLVISATLSSPGLVVDGDVFYPGWTASIDGSTVPIVRANATLRGVYVPAGLHLIRYLYHPRSIELGSALSLGSIILLILCFTVDASAKGLRTRRTMAMGLAIAVAFIAIAEIAWYVADPFHERGLDVSIAAIMRTLG